MSRYVNEIMPVRDPAEALSIGEGVLTDQGFQKITHNGEVVWKRGMGVLTGPGFVKLEVTDGGAMHVEAWIKMALLPGVYVGELGLEGFFGALPKKTLRARVTQLEQMLAS